MNEKREQFLAGERPDDVLLFFNEEAVDGLDRLAEVGEAVENGVVIVLPGEEGRTAFQRATGVDPMQLAGSAMHNESEIARDCTDGECPDSAERSSANRSSGEGTEPRDADEDGDHWPRFVFGFAEEENEEVGGRYADGDVIHAYALCDCGTAYSQKWIAGERA
ncbi:DUF5807 family protein [Halorientalis salina]|uniref:DUF5807 family protein n=1 Tax=Halorientalis salina TaxID=2932266 RepID=UPI0010ABA0F3|nr:DUF5807 family protein [Halorientalis salina]